MKRKLVTLLLAIALLTMMLPLTMLSVFADDSGTTEKNITLGTAAISNGDKANKKWDYVYFGKYEDTPIKWRVLSTSGNGGTYKDANGDEYSSNAMFLFSEYALENMKFNEKESDHTWQGSVSQKWLQETFGTASNFSNEELLTVLKTTKTDSGGNLYELSWKAGGLNSDTFFYISAREVMDYLGGNKSDESLKAYYYNNTSAVTGWWLRSPYEYSSKFVGSVNSSGSVDRNNVHDTRNAARPAFNLNPTSVLFTSSAQGGKTAFGANADLASSEGYKLTLLDTSRSGFSAEILRTPTNTYVSYTGATTGANEYITAMIVNASGEVTYYGSLKNVTASSEASGSIKIDLSGMNSGDKLYVINEQWNGDYNTDYASALTEVTVPTVASVYYVAFDANGGTGTMNGIFTESPNYTLPECAFTYAGCTFVGWSYTVGGEVIKENSITLAQDVTLYAVWLARGEKIGEIEDAIAALENAKTELNNALATKADTETVNAAIQELQNAINALEAVKDNYVSADAELKSDLEDEIATAKSEAITAATALVEAAKTELNEAIAEKADTATVNAAIQELQNAIDALEAVKDNYVSADAELKSDLEDEIATAKSEAITAATALVENAKTELNEAIAEKADTATVNAAIQELQNAIDTLEAAKDNYLSADAALKTDLETKIATAKSEAITAATALVENAKKELEAKDAELTEKDSELQTFITITCVLSSVTLGGFGAFATWFFIDRKKTRG